MATALGGVGREVVVLVLGLALNINNNHHSDVGDDLRIIMLTIKTSVPYPVPGKSLCP